MLKKLMNRLAVTCQIFQVQSMIELASLNEEAYEELNCWLCDWEDFNRTLKDLDWIRDAEELDEEDVEFSQNTEDSLKELEQPYLLQSTITFD